MKLKPETLLLIAAEFAVAAVGGYGLRQGVNRANQALERIAAASEASSRPPLPRPSLLHRADLKPIPSPDPEPCGDAVACREDFERELNRTEKAAWERVIERLPGHPYIDHLPTLGGTAVER